MLRYIKARWLNVGSTSTLLPTNPGIGTDKNEGRVELTHPCRYKSCYLQWLLTMAIIWLGKTQFVAPNCSPVLGVFVGNMDTHSSKSFLPNHWIDGCTMLH